MKTLTKTTALFASGALLIAGVAAGVHAADRGKAPKSVNVAVDNHPLARDTKMNASFAPVFKKVGPSVVKVFTTTKGRVASADSSPFFNDPLFQQFFGNQFGGPQGMGRPRQFQTPAQHGLGSGVIVSEDGYILTNNHVVDGADEIKVALQDGREFKAKVVGRDPKSDIAVLKINADKLSRITMADSDKAEVGDVVLAVGDPYGVGQTLTMGIISAKGRATMGLAYEDFIQTDAAINPGNSGGALVDTEGRLIGINTAIYSRTGGYQGIGFAIPSNLARSVMDSLIKYGKVSRGYIGVMIQDVTPALAKEFNLKNDKGALVSDVEPDGPAKKAGLKSGDVILEFNGKPVDDSRHLKLEVARAKPGTTAPVKILRDGTTKTVDITLKELPGEHKAGNNSNDQSDNSGTLQGVGVADLDSNMRQQFDVPENIHGVIVTQVDENSAAAEAGLKPGDVIMEINRHPVKSADEAVRMTEHAKEKTTLLHVWSPQGTHYLVVDESDR